MKRSFFLLTAIGAVTVLVGAGCNSRDLTGGLQTAELPNEPPKPVQIMPTEPKYVFPGVLPKEQTDKRVRIQTPKGDIVIELLPDEGPNAASNFVYLIGKEFYNGLTFHRYEQNFVIQGGDPNGNGTGGPGYSFQDDPVNSNYDRGMVAMANAGPNTNGSQFFIMLDDVPLPPMYSIFGRVIEGMEVVDQIRVGDVMTTVTIEPKS
jgi:cyclophilin family peptidyl-prolyl cis-trans isomerase